MPPDVSPTPEEARATRRTKLFAKWSRAGRLSQEELAEIADMIAAANGEHPGLKLEVVDDLKPGTYLRTYEWYAQNLPFDPAATVESKVRTIKRWVRAGRDHSPVQDFPPLDDPPRIGAWLRRVMRRWLTAWDGFLAMAEPPPVPGEQVPTKNSTKPITAGETPPPPTAASVDLTKYAGFSAIENLEAQRRVVAATYDLYSSALLAGTPDLDQRQRAYTAASAELRKMEKDTEELREARGELIPRDRLTAELRRLHTAMAGALRAELRDRTGSVLTPDLSAEIITAFFRPLRTGDFGLPETAPLPAPNPPPPPAPADPAA